MRRITLALPLLACLGLSVAFARAGAEDFVAWVESLQPNTLLRGTFTLKEVESVTGLEVYVSGPHRDGAFDFDSTTDFGHYNPAFVRFVIDSLLSDRVPAARLQGLAKKFRLFTAIRRRLDSLSAARCQIQREPEQFAEFKKEYLALIHAGDRFSAYGSFSKWNHWDAPPRHDYNAEDLAFWARREWDGTAEILRDGFIVALRKFDFSAYLAFVGCLREDAPDEETLRLFTPESFVDHRDWGDPSALRCREELIRQHTWSEPGELQGRFFPRTALDARIDDAEAIKDALTAAGCSDQWVTGPHFGLVHEAGQLRWQSMELELALEFTYHDGCWLKQLVDLRVQIADPSAAPLLLRAGEPRAVPGFFSRARDETARDSRRETVDLVASEIPGLDSVFKTLDIHPDPYAFEPGADLVHEISLWAEFEGGHRTKLATRHLAGKSDYGYSEPTIDDVMILDVNGDGEPDFLYDSDNEGRYLVLTKDKEILMVITLVTDQYSGVGGC